MATSTWMLELGRASWRLIVSRGDEVAAIATAEFEELSLIDQAVEVHRALLQGGHSGEAVVLALDSIWCLAASIRVNRPQDLRDRQAMLYRLEESIPWNAEEIVADFAAKEDAAFAVAVLIEPLLGFLNRLTACGIQTQNIVPSALLAAYGQIAKCKLEDRCTLVFDRGGWADVLTVSNGNVTSWATMPASTESVGRHVDAMALEHGSAGAVVGCGLNAAMFEALRARHGSVRLSAVDQPSVADLTIAAASQLVDGSLELPIDLKQGPFGRTRRSSALQRPILALQLAVAILVFSLTGALLYQGHACARQALEASSQQAKVFQSVFPNSKVPTGITTRLRSELAKLKGLRGDDGTLPTNTSTVVVLKELLAALPVDKRIRLLEIRIENGRLYLDGEARAHSDAELLTQRIRGQGFEAPSPKTQRLDDQRVSMRITASYKPSSATAKE